jgi:hypothetical protein
MASRHNSGCADVNSSVDLGTGITHNAYKDHLSASLKFYPHFALVHLDLAYILMTPAVEPIKSLSPRAETVVSSDPRTMNYHTTIDVVIVLGKFAFFEMSCRLVIYSPSFRLNYTDPFERLPLHEFFS